MTIFQRIAEAVRRWGSRLIPYKDIAAEEQIRTPLAPEMAAALALWCDLYHNRAPWKEPGKVKSLNLCAMAAGEIARQVVLELGWHIGPEGTGNEAIGRPEKGTVRRFQRDGAGGPEGTGNADGEAPGSRAAWLNGEFAGLMDALRLKLEVGCAAGGMIVKPCPDPATGKVYFDFAPDWSLYPLAFDGAGNLVDVIIPDVFREGNAIFTRLERHTLSGDDVTIRQRAFRSSREGVLGVEVPLDAVPRWAALQPEVTVTGAGGMLFGWFRVAAANTVDADCPLGASVFARGVEVAREIDLQYSRLLWEFEGGELAVDVDPTALYEKSDGRGRALPRLNERLFRAVDTGAESTYQVFAPTLRDASLVNGLNQLLIRFEDLCGLSRGTFSDANVEARTATELRIARQRSYATVADNQRALERCLRDVLRAMDVYATLYGLAPAGAWTARFDWDDSVLTDAGEQLRQRLMLLEAGVLTRAELRQWYLGESPEQAEAAVTKIRGEGKTVEEDGDEAFFRRE